MSDTRTPDGYDMCPDCRHHTSAFCGSCTAIVPLSSESGDLMALERCGCDCYKALHGVSLMEKIFGSGQEKPG